MTGRDLILYILSNNLENEPIVKNGRLVGFLTAEEVAVKTNVGVASVYAWTRQGRLDSVYVTEGIYIPANSKLPIE